MSTYPSQTSWRLAHYQYWLIGCYLRALQYILCLIFSKMCALNVFSISFQTRGTKVERFVCVCQTCNLATLHVIVDKHCFALQEHYFGNKYTHCRLEMNNIQYLQHGRKYQIQSLRHLWNFFQEYLNEDRLISCQHTYCTCTYWAI